MPYQNKNAQYTTILIFQLCGLMLCTTPACFSTFLSTMVSILVNFYAEYLKLTSVKDFSCISNNLRK